MSLRTQNMEAFGTSLDQVLAQYKTTPPKSQLQAVGDDWNVVKDGHLLFNHGARVDAEKLISAVKKSPARILFGKPSMIFAEAAAEGDRHAAKGNFEFATQRYDDANSDEHILDFQREVASAFHTAGIEVTEKIQRDEPYYVISYGLGLGFQLRMIWDIWKPKTLIVVEPDKEMLWHSLDVFDWASLVKEIRASGAQITLIVDDKPRDLLGRLNASVQGECIMGLDGLLAVKVSNHPTVNIVFNEFQSSKTGSLASYMGYIVDEYNMMKNSFRNLRTGNRRILNKARVTAQMPALIVGSGPSLEQNLDFIRSVRDRVVLISSGSSMAVLLRNGIVPDMQAVLERAKGNYDRHVELAREFDLKQIHAILTTTIWPGTADFFRDAVFFLRPALSPLALFCHSEYEVLNGEGPQVTNTAFAFAGRLGFKEIYLLGVDLGARDPARPRAERAWLTPGLKQRNLNIPVRGNFGRTVFTDNPLLHQRVTIENQIARLSKAGTRVFNLGDGVLINGAKPLQPSAVSLTAAGVDREAHVRELVGQFPIMSRERFVSDWESSQVRVSVAKMVQKLTDLIAEAPEWNHALMRQLEIVNQYVGKPLKNQYAPRLLRGSVLRMCLYLQAVLIRTRKEDEAKILELIKPLWAAMMKRLEMESYELADELENEDPYFRGDLSEGLAVDVELAAAESQAVSENEAVGATAVASAAAPSVASAAASSEIPRPRAVRTA